MSRGSLSDLVDQVTTKATGRKSEGLPYVGLEHIEPGARTLVDTAPSSISVSTNGVFESGDVLFGKLRPNLRKAVQVTFGGYCSTDFLIMRPRSGIHPRYAGHVASSDAVFRHAERNSIGTGMPRTSWHAVSQAPISVPPLEEQRRIAEILDAMDETISATERTIARQRAIRAGISADLFDSRLVSTGRSNVSSPNSRQHDTKDEKTWRRCLLTDIADSTVDGPFGSALKTGHYVDDPGVRVIRLANLGDGVFLDEDEAFIDDDYAKMLDRHKVQAGDVLVASLGDDAHRPGRACLYPTEFAPGIVKADCFRIRPSASVNSRFLVGLLNSKGVVTQLRQLAQGVTRDRVTLTHLRQVVLRLPPLEEQRRIAERLNSIDAAIGSEEERLDKVRQLRAGLAADLLSGRVRTVPT